MKFIECGACGFPFCPLIPSEKMCAVCTQNIIERQMDVVIDLDKYTMDRGLKSIEITLQGVKYIFSADDLVVLLRIFKNLMDEKKIDKPSN
jgi:hypothetical protein